MASSRNHYRGALCREPQRCSVRLYSSNKRRVGYLSDIGSNWLLLRFRISCAAFRNDRKRIHFQSDQGRFGTSGLVLISLSKTPRLGGPETCIEPKVASYYALPLTSSRCSDAPKPNRLAIPSITGLESPASQAESASRREWLSRDQCRLRVEMPWLGVYPQLRSGLDGPLVRPRQRSISSPYDAIDGKHHAYALTVTNEIDQFAGGLCGISKLLMANTAARFEFHPGR
jgi:hypothetical protein